MNEKNFEYLSDQLKFTGFGQQLQAQLREAMLKAQTEFRLDHTTQYGKDQLSSSLHFKKSTQSDLYFFESYSASLKKEKQDQPLKQTFYIHKQIGNITQKEAFNLLDGRAVNKEMINREGKQYSAWIQLDFKETTVNGNFKFRQFSQNYGFELEKSLAKLPIAELSEPTHKANLIESLQKGNRQVATLSGGSGDQKVFLEANPQFKAIIAYDQNQRRLTLDRPGHTQSQTQQQPVQNHDASRQLTAGEQEPLEPALKTRAQRRL